MSFSKEEGNDDDEAEVIFSLILPTNKFSHPLGFILLLAVYCFVRLIGNQL